MTPTAHDPPLPTTTIGQSGGEMGKRIRTLDWSTTPLGPIEHWPQSLRTVVNILLSSRYAMWMAWGPELTFLCNDAYRPTLGIKDPWALGARADRVWAEIWPDISPRIETVLTTGEATYDEGLLLFLERSGFPEETYHTFSYSPLADDHGRINGMLCVVTEETERLLGERRVETLRDVASALASTNTEEEVLQALKDQFSRNKKDLPFTLTYLFDTQGLVHLASSTGISLEHLLAAPRIAPDAVFPWPAQEIFLSPVPRVEDLLERCGGIAPPAGDWNKPAEQAVVVPIRQQGQERPAGFLVAGINPYRRYDAAYSGFVDLLAGQIAAGLSNARAYEAERRRAESLAEIDRAKTTFFSNVSHELRTPLTLLLSPVEELLAHERTAQDPERRQLLELVHRNGLRLQRLVNTLLDFSRIEAGRLQAVYEPTDLSHFTSELAGNFRSAMEKAGLEFRVECSPELPPVYVDRNMWEKIVLNLLSNALKFTFEGRVQVRLSGCGSYVELAVEDTGTGIPASELEHIFERFHRVAGARGRSIEGTGIGLALVQELVKLHGGSIVVESELAKGTAFKVRIPFGAAHLPDAEHSPNENRDCSPARKRGDPSQEGGLSSTALHSDIFVQEALRWLEASPGSDARQREQHTERVLLADDNPDMRDYVTRLLSDRYEVNAVSSGDEALEAALNHPPDLILSDVMMPGLDGFALLRELRARPQTRTIPVVLLSARAGEESRVEGLGAGADDYLIKPFTARELLARVASHLSMSRKRREAEEALKQSQATLQSFYDSSTFLMGVVEIPSDEIVPVYCNAAAANFFGVPRATDDLWIRHYRQSQREGGSIHFEYMHPRASDSIWLSASVNYLGNGPTGRPRFSFIAEDITVRKKHDDLLRRSNEDLKRANADLEQFAYSASHDLQEPLRQVAIYSQMLERKYAARLDSQASEYLGFCIEGAQRMEMLISDLLAYSQSTRSFDSPPQRVDTNEVLETVKKNLATRIQETGAVISVGDLPVVYGDSVPLMHVFQNLVSNALKYRGDAPPLVSVSAEKHQGYWRFAVRDNGIGIAEQFHEQIFGIFKRLHPRNEYPGTGIGLAICQKVVERYGGRIWVESEEGHGSTFFFTLPDNVGQAHAPNAT
jgi:signal transduction histidine kinase/FixJ family two-component response regulator